MAEFGELLRRYRDQSRDLNTGKPLTQSLVADLLQYRTGLTYANTTISTWERGENHIDKDNRLLLVGLIQILHECGGLQSLAEANRLLATGNYRELDVAEITMVNAHWLALGGDRPNDNTSRLKGTSKEVGFGELLRLCREKCRDLNTGRPLTQNLVANLLQAKTGLSYTNAAVSEWERGKSRIDKDDRLILIGLIQILHECGGLQSLAEANRLLATGNYRELDVAEITQINSHWLAPGGGKPEDDTSSPLKVIQTEATPTLVIGLGGAGLKVATLILKGVKETNNNQPPRGFVVLVADTEATIKYAVEGWSAAHGQHHATGPVSIGAGNYIPLTGNVKKIAEAIRDEQEAAAADPSLRRWQARRHMNSWFQAHYYLNEVYVDDSVWNLEVGAGRFRQFGRLGFFNHVNGRVKVLLENAIHSIRDTGATNFQVHILGSLVGGTGAGIFIDFPNLIQKIALQAGFAQSPTIIGHFILAEAFRGNRKVNLANEGTKRAFDAHTYACLRELTRLQSDSPPNAGGYPLIYDPGSVGMFNSKLDKSPYTYCYLYDGQRSRNALNGLEIEEGLAPSIADVVLAYVDGLSGPAIQSHTVNYKAYYGSHRIPVGQVTYGSIGTYTIELPIYHITEGWAYRLAKDVLDIVLAPQRGESGGITLVTNMPGGKERDPEKAAKAWVLEEGQVTGLIGRIVRWGTQARTKGEKNRIIDELSGFDAETWLRDLAPTDAAFSTYVADAQDDLNGSLTNTASRYRVDHNQEGDSAETRANNLVEATEAQLRAMVGPRDGVWLRAGGNFRVSLARLANHHRHIFETEMVHEVDRILNGTEGEARERKQGKVGFARAWLEALQETLRSAESMLADAVDKASKDRRDRFTTLNAELAEMQNIMQRSSGVFSSNLKTYRNKADELAQFHKADIAREVIQDLTDHLVKSVDELGSELDYWIGSLATTTSAYGGAYNLLLDGIREVQLDRERSKNAARWVIDDVDRIERNPGASVEKPNPYIENWRKRYLGRSLDSMLDAVSWRVEQTNTGEFRVQFTTHDQPWDRRAGRSGERQVGQKNAGYLIARCRAIFEPAWQDMSVTQYLFQNFLDKETALVEQVYDNSGPLLALHGRNEPPLSSVFMCVSRENLTSEQSRFLDQMLTHVRIKFGDTTSGQVRETVIRVAGGEYAASLLDADGQDSYERFKLTYIMFGDLLQPHEIAGYVNARQHYREYSNDGRKWKELHILPAETNALAIEREMSRLGKTGAAAQRRRELNDAVVTVLEDMDRFQLAMLCLAYGEETFAWSTGSRGLLLHKFTPRENNPDGKSYWRLTVMPEGAVVQGQVAQPTHYQLSYPANDPNLWQAILQLVAIGTSNDTGAVIDFQRLEATIEYAQTTHQKRLQLAGLLTWQPVDRYRHDKQFREEGLAKAAQVVRLNSHIDELDQALLHSDWRWAWQQSPSGTELKAPEDMPDDTQKRIRRDVDLYTALRWVATSEREQLAHRLAQLGVWPNGGIEPRVKISLAENSETDSLSADDPSGAAIGEYIVLSLDASHVEVDNTINLSIGIAENAKSTDVSGELVCLVDTIGFTKVRGETEIAFILRAGANHKEQMLTLRANRAGEQRIVVRPFFNDHPLPEHTLTVRVHFKAAPREVLPDPIGVRQTPDPDLVLRVYTTPTDASGETIRLEYVLYSPHKRLVLPGFPMFPIVLQLAALNRLRTRLQTILSDASWLAPDETEAALAGLGHALYDALFPNGLKDIYWKHREVIHSWLILCDAEPWIPWELVKPYGTGWQDPFLGERFELARWIEGWGVARQSEFPLGTVCLAAEPQPDQAHLVNEWSELIAAGEWRHLNGALFAPWPEGIAAALKYDTSIWGLHLLAAPEGAQTKALATTGNKAGTLSTIHATLLDLQRKAPLVTAGLSTRTDRQSLSQIESRWMSTFVRAGAAAFVGALWATDSQADRLFWSVFYQAVWQRDTLGSTVHKAQRVVREALPHMSDAMAYFLVGDPMARGYLPDSGNGFAVLECGEHDINTPLQIGHRYRFTATLRQTPPIWYTNRRHRALSDSWETLSISISASGVGVEPQHKLTLQRIAPNMYMTEFVLTPEQSGEQDLFVRFIANESQLLHMMTLPFVVE